MAKKKIFTENELDDIMAQSRSFWQKATTAMEPFFDIVNDCERLWRSQLPQELEDQFKKIPDRAALCPPDIYMNLRSLRANLRKVLFSRKPFGKLSREGEPNKRDESIVKAESVLQAQLDQHAEGRGFEAEADKAFHQALYAGVGAAFTRWVRRWEKFPIRNETGEIATDDDGNIRYENRLVAEYAETKSIDVRRVRIDPAAESQEDIRIVGYHSLARISDLFIKNRLPDSHYDFDEKELLATSFQREKYYEYVKGEDTRYGDKGDDNFGFSDKVAEVRELRGLFRFEKPDGTMTFEDLVVSIANDTMIIAIKRNDLPIPGWKLFDFPKIDDELGRFYTMGAVEPMMDTWVEKFIKMNQSLDESTRRTYDRYIGDKSACEDLDDFIEDIPGQILKVDLIASGARSVNEVIQPLPRPSTGHDTFNQAGFLTTVLQQGMFLNDYTQGLDPSRQETATAVDSLVTGGQSLTSHIAEVLKDTYLSPAWRKQLILWNFFKGHETNQVYDFQGIPYEISPGELDAMYRIDIDIATSIDRPAMVRRFVEWLPMAKVDPYFDQYELRRTELEVLKLPNADKILKSNEHMEKEVHNENAALMEGVAQIVSPQDSHQQHIKIHVEGLKWYQERVNSGQMPGGNEPVFQKHIEEHQNILAEQQSALGNTKETGGLSGGQQASGENASTPAPQIGQARGV